MFTEDDLDSIFRAYLVCAIWTGLDYSGGEDSEPVQMDEDHDADDIADETVAELFAELAEFLNAANSADLALMDMEQIGHDFCLTRNHHGAGFWDRGLGEAGERLTKLAQSFGESDLCVGDDGLIYA